MPILRFIAVVEINLTRAMRTSMILKVLYIANIYLVRSHDLKLNSVLTYADLNIQNIKLSKLHVRAANLDLMHRKFIQPNRPPLPQPHHAKPNEFPVNEWNLLTLGKRVSVSRRAWFTAWSLTNRAPGDVRSGWRRRRQLKLRHLVENLADAAAAAAQIGRHFSVKSHSNFYTSMISREISCSSGC